MATGALYDASVSPESLIASVRLTASRRAAHIVAPYKADNWENLVADCAAISLRLTAEGITSASWIATLLARQDAGTFNTYRGVLPDGDSHLGDFVIEMLEERMEGEWRRFTLVLRSSGQPLYFSA